MTSVIWTNKNRKNENSRGLSTSRKGRRRASVFFFVMFLLSWIFTLSGCTGAKKKTVTVFALDTYVTLTAEGKDAGRAVKDASDLLLKMEDKLSRMKEDSEIVKLNQSTKEEPVTLSEDTYYLLTLVLDYAAKTKGRFDPTIAPVMDLWGFGTDNPHVPDPVDVSKTKEKVDYKKVHLLSNRRAYVDPDTSIDLGGAAKGFIGDILLQKLRTYDLKKIILDLGGNVCAWSSSSEVSIGIVSPKNTTELCCTYSLPAGEASCVITSGAYERYFEENGVKYGHIIDTKTGNPASTDILSVTVIGADGTKGDVFSTALFSMGSGEAMKLAKKQHIDCILCLDNGTLWVSSSLKEKVHAQEGWTIEYFG